MLALILAGFFFANPVVMNETGHDYLGEQYAKACEALDGKWDANARVNTVGRNKEYRDAPSHVPYCTRGPIDLIIDEVGPLVDEVL